VPEPKGTRKETGRDSGRGNLEEPGSLPEFSNPLAPVTDHRGPGVLGQLVRRVVANPVHLPALGLGVLPRAVSRDLANATDGTVQETVPAAGEDELLVHELGQGPPARLADSLAVDHQGNGAGRMRLAKLVAA
jgi:hypothetical protein